MKKPHGCYAQRAVNSKLVRLHSPHKSHRVGWLRAAVLGANDGIVSTASLVIGVAAAGVAHSDIILAGVAGLVAGAMSMAAGEYVSVSSQSDTEKADLQLEQHSLDKQFDLEIIELANIYESRGVSPVTAREVAEQLMAFDPLAAHARDDIGISDTGNADPIQAALAGATTFAVGASLPLLLAWLVNRDSLIAWVALASLVFLSALGGLAARAGGASIMIGALRVTFWGALAMGITAAVGQIFA